jgi:phage tail sheath gpL-like
MGGVSTQIPESWNLPLFWATVDGSMAGNLTEVLPALLVGQYNAQGTAQTSSGTLTSSAVLTFGANNVPAYIVPGMVVTDITTPTAITGGQTVLSVQATTVTLSANVNVAVVTGDIINFAWPSNPGLANGLLPNVALPIGSVAQARALCGLGSMLERMVTAFFAVNTTQLLYILPIPDPAAGVKATGTIAITSPPTASGVLTIYIAGQVVNVTVNSTDVATAIATNLAAAINATPELPVVATASTNTVTLTCRWFGLTGNDITLIPNYYGVVNGEAFPAGVNVTITPMASGTGNPAFVNAIANIQVLEFDYVGMPYTDVASVNSWGNEYGFQSGGRWNFTRQQYGFIVNSMRNTFSNLITTGLTMNTPVVSTMAIEPLAPSPIWEWAAAYCGLAALAFTDDPARPLQTLPFTGILPASLQNRFSQANINNLTNGGFAIQSVLTNTTAIIMREQTNYQFNSFGQGDTAFGLLTVLATLSELLRRMKSSITSKYPRMKLVPDGTRLSPGQAAVTPTDVKAELIAEFIDAEFDGLVADLPDFQANLIVQIDPNNPNKLQVLWPPQLAGQLRQFDVLAQFRLLYPTVQLT